MCMKDEAIRAGLIQVISQPTGNGVTPIQIGINFKTRDVYFTNNAASAYLVKVDGSGNSVRLPFEWWTDGTIFVKVYKREVLGNDPAVILMESPALTAIDVVRYDYSDHVYSELSNMER